MVTYNYKSHIYICPPRLICITFKANAVWVDLQVVCISIVVFDVLLQFLLQTLRGNGHVQVDLVADNHAAHAARKGKLNYIILK